MNITVAGLFLEAALGRCTQDRPSDGFDLLDLQPQHLLSLVHWGNQNLSPAKYPPLYQSSLVRHLSDFSLTESTG